MASEASVVEQTVVEKMQNIVSEDTNNANEASLLQAVVKGKDEEEKIIVEDLANVHAAIPEPEGKDKSISEPPIEAKDDCLKENIDAPNDTQPSNEPVVEHHEDVSVKYIIEDSVQTPNEPVLSKTAGEGNSVQESPEVPAVGQESAYDATTVILDSNGTEENPTSEESTYGAIEVSPESSKEEVPQSGISEQILDQISEVVSIESNTETSNTIPTTQVAQLAKEEIDGEEENEEKNTDVKETASAKTIKNEDDGLEEQTNAPNDTQPLNEPVVEQHEDVLEKSITETPKEPTLSETVGEDNVQESSETSTLDQESAHDATIILNSNGTEENPTGGEPFYDVFPVIPTETKELKEQTVTSELPTQKTDDDLNADPANEKTTEEEDKLVVSTESNAETPNITPTTEVAKLAKEESDVKEENGQDNIDGKETASTETTQTVANNGSEEAVKTSDGVELIDQVKNENLEGETTRDIEVVQVENKVSNDPQSDSKESVTEVKSVTKQTLLDRFATENAEDGKQETAQVGDRSIEVTAKDGGGGATKTDQEADKAEISGKKSKSVMSKVKQSIVKVKKAIIGKSPSSKTMTPEGIDDAKAK